MPHPARLHSPVPPRLRLHVIALGVLLHASASAKADAIPAGDATPPSLVAVVDAGTGSSRDAVPPWRTDRFYLETSVHTWHFREDPRHDDRQKLVRLEWNVTEQWLAGAASFHNSFGQPSQYVYGGYRFRPFDSAEPLYLKLSAGLVHGYKGDFQHKISLNSGGIAPVVIPSLGYCVDRLCSELVVFGNAGALLTLGLTLP